MNKLILLILVALAVDCAFAYTYIVPASMGKSKDKENYCFHKESGKHIKRGGTITTKDCEEISCWSDYSIQINGCGTFAVNDPSCLRWEQDYSKPYPECCMPAICVEFNKDYMNLDEETVNTNVL